MKKLCCAILLLTVLISSMVGCGKSKPGNMMYDKYDGTEDYYYAEAQETGFAGSAEYEMYYDSDTADMSVSQSVKTDARAESDAANRKIIKRANIGYETNEFESFLSGLSQCISAHKGYIESSETNLGGIYSSRSRNAYLVVRIPVDSYDEFMTSVCSLGSVTYKNEDSDDVTMKYVDTESHIRALESEYNALLEILDKAESLTDVLALQSRISEVNYQMDSYKSQIRKYDDLISYCTVSINVSEVVRETKDENKMSFSEKIKNGLSDSFYNISEDASDFAIWFVTKLPYLVIWAVVIFLAVIIIRAIAKKNKKKKNEKAMKQYMINNAESSESEKKS